MTTDPGGSGAGSTVDLSEALRIVKSFPDQIETLTIENAQLRADLEAARGEIRHLIEDRDHALAVAKSEQQWTHAAWVEIEQLKERIRGQSVAELLDLIAARRDLQQSLADLAQARARIEAVTEALEKATWLLDGAAENIDEWFPNDEHPDVQRDLRTYAAKYREQFSLRYWREALDAAQAAGDGQEQPCCSQHQPHTSNPKCPAGEKHWVSSQWSSAERPELQLADDDDEPPGEPGSYKRAIGALAGQDLRMSPERAVRRVRDNDNSGPDHTDVVTDTRAEGPQEAI